MSWKGRTLTGGNNESYIKKLTTLALRETQCFTKLLVVNIPTESTQHMLKENMCNGSRNCLVKPSSDTIFSNSCKYFNAYIQNSLQCCSMATSKYWLFLKWMIESKPSYITDLIMDVINSIKIKGKGVRNRWFWESFKEGKRDVSDILHKWL